MKIKNIEKVLKRTRTVVIMRDSESKILWLSDEKVYMPLFNFSNLTWEQVASLLNISEDEIKKWSFYEEPLPENICFDEYMPPDSNNEELLERSRVLIQYGGFTVEPFSTSRGVIFLNTEDIIPFEKEDKNIQLFARFNEEGLPYVVVKAGMFLKGIILNNTTVVTRELSNLLAYTAQAIKNHLTFPNGTNSDADNAV